VQSHIARENLPGESIVAEKSRQKMPTDHPAIEEDSWRTFKRVLPRDIHQELKRFEELVATHSGLPPRFEGIGASVTVWTILCHALRNCEPEIVQLAREWADQESGTAEGSTFKTDR
jgi:hypothetical protein